MSLPSTYWAVLMRWQDANVAIAETYFNSAATFGTPPTGLYGLALQLFKARSLLMGAGVVPLYFRISQVGSFRTYYPSDPADVSQAAVGPITRSVNSSSVVLLAGGANVVDGASAQGPDAVIVNYIGPSLANHSRHYFAGVPNVLIRTNPQGPWVIGDQGWGNTFNAYKSVLLANGWVMRCRTNPTIPNPPAPVVWGLDSTSTYLTITCPTIAGVIVNSSKIQIRGTKMASRAYASPNGSWPVIAAAAPVGGNTAYTLGGTQGIAFAQIQFGTGNAQLVDYTLVQYTTALLGREGTHKRGNSPLAPRGKRRTVQRILF
jgi:hypothetical protein